MNSLAINHFNTTTPSFGLGAEKAAGAASRTYQSSSVQFGKSLEESAHSHQMERLWTDSHYSMNSASKVSFGGTNAGWVPFGASTKSTNRLNVVA